MAVQITVAGGDLYRIAATQLGDASQWWRIAQANAITDPVLSGVIALDLPQRNASLTDGLPPA